MVEQSLFGKQVANGYGNEAGVYCSIYQDVSAEADCIEFHICAIQQYEARKYRRPYKLYLSCALRSPRSPLPLSEICDRLCLRFLFRFPRGCRTPELISYVRLRKVVGSFTTHLALISPITANPTDLKDTCFLGGSGIGYPSVAIAFRVACSLQWSAFVPEMESSRRSSLQTHTADK